MCFHIADTTGSINNGTATNNSHVFRVPDSDNEEEPAVGSRAPSVEVVESHMRTKTYSVPSESDAEIEISSKSNSDCEELKSALFTPQSKDKESPITSPDEDRIARAKVLCKEIFGTPNKGSSQYDPIDIDDRKPDEEERDKLAKPHNSYFGTFRRGVARKTAPTNFEDTGK